MPEAEVWVIDRVGKGVVAMIAIKDSWIEHLHVDPELTRRGLGTQLLDFAREWCVDGLDLWTFESNAGARRFYEKRGFVAVEMTEDANEEKAPDVHYHWTP
jgi:GNAT superfamily N-acetyltransferase